MGLNASANVVVWAGLSNSQSIGYSYTALSKRLKISTLKGIRYRVIERRVDSVPHPSPNRVLKLCVSNCLLMKLALIRVVIFSLFDMVV